MGTKADSWVVLWTSLGPLLQPKKILSNNKQVSNLVPFPGEAVVEALGNAFTKTSDAAYLISQLFDNPAINYEDKTKELVNLKLNKVMEILKSISKDLDKNDSSNS